MIFSMFLQDNGVTLGLSTSQALKKLWEQLNNLLEQHQRAARRRTSTWVRKHINTFYDSCQLLHLKYVHLGETPPPK